MRVSFTAVGLAVVIALAMLSNPGAYVLRGVSWPSGSIVMQMQLGSSGSALSDGSASWNAAAEGPLASWNTYMSRASFKVVRDSTAPIADGDGVNNVFWADSRYGSPFPSGVLATTISRWVGTSLTDADVVFNRGLSWNSYRGRQWTDDVIDIRRVALHEFGHVLGLLHPDAFGQSVSSIMNAYISDLETLTPDDQAGAQALYGAGSTPPPSALPGAPSGFTTSAVGTSVAMTWRAPTSGGTLTTYYIESGSSSGLANLANFSTGSTATSFSADRVGLGTYYVRVRAANASGAGPASNEAIMIVGGGSGAPGAPTSFTTSTFGTLVTMTWTAPVGGPAPTGYTIESGSSSGLSNLGNNILDIPRLSR